MFLQRRVSLSINILFLWPVLGVVCNSSSFSHRQGILHFTLVRYSGQRNMSRGERVSVPGEAFKVQRVLPFACAHSAETGEAPLDTKLPQIRAPQSDQLQHGEQRLQRVLAVIGNVSRERN